MEALLAVAIGVLFGCGIFLMLRRSVLRLIIGLVLLSHGVNLILFLVGRLKKGGIPVQEGLLPPDPSRVTDPLVQALVLTAIVISFGVTAFILVAAYRVHQEYESDDLDELRRLKG